MKVLFALDALINAGAEKSTLHLVSEFSKSTEVHLAYFYPKHDLKQDFINVEVQLHYLHLKGKYSFISGISKMIDLIRKEKPDIVVSSIFRANLICRIACMLTKTKLVGTFISDSYSHQRTNSFSASRKAGFVFFKWVDRITSEIPIKWVSNSQCIADSNCKALKIDKHKVTVIYRGRNSSIIKKLEQPVTNKNFVFVSVGRLLETKGYQDIINAFKILIAEYPNISLEIYGEGEYRKKLQELIAKLDIQANVTMHGNIHNAWTKLYQANCFIFSSWYEGFSGSLVEAMMTGLPIIASDIPMNLEAVELDKTALIHQTKNVRDIVTKMKKMITEYPSMIKMGERAREAAIEKFDIKKVAAQYESFLYQTIEGE